MTESGLPPAMRLDESKELQICRHITLGAYEPTDGKDSEYIERLKIHCSECKKSFWWRIMIN